MRRGRTAFTERPFLALPSVDSAGYEQPVGSKTEISSAISRSPRSARSPGRTPGRPACARGGPRYGPQATAVPGRTRPRSRSTPRSPPLASYLRPGLAPPGGDRILVPLSGPVHRNLRAEPSGKRGAGDVGELARARRVQDLTTAAVLPDPRAERRRLLAEPGSARTGSTSPRWVPLNPVRHGHDQPGITSGRPSRAGRSCPGNRLPRCHRPGRRPWPTERSGWPGWR